MHNTRAICSNAAVDNAKKMLPFVQLTHNTAYYQTLGETLHFLMFGRRASLPVDVILGVPPNDSSASKLGSSRHTVGKLQLAYERAHRNSKERADKKNRQILVRNLPSRSSNQGKQVLVHRPHPVADGPSSKLIRPWHGSSIIQSQVSSAYIYRVSRDGKLAETTVHLDRI